MFERTEMIHRQMSIKSQDCIGNTGSCIQDDDAIFGFEMKDHAYEAKKSVRSVCIVA